MADLTQAVHDIALVNIYSTSPQQLRWNPKTQLEPEMFGYISHRSKQKFNKMLHDKALQDYLATDWQFTRVCYQDLPNVTNLFLNEKAKNKNTLATFDHKSIFMFDCLVNLRYTYQQ